MIIRLTRAQLSGGVESIYGMDLRTYLPNLPPVCIRLTTADGSLEGWLFTKRDVADTAWKKTVKPR